jgi:hypothetical protein
MRVHVLKLRLMWVSVLQNSEAAFYPKPVARMMSARSYHVLAHNLSGPSQPEPHFSVYNSFQSCQPCLYASVLGLKNSTPRISPFRIRMPLV